MSTIKTLVANANSRRLEVVKGIERTVQHGYKVDTTDLQVVSLRPQALGFSDGDLQFYANHYRNRQGKAMGFVQKMNLKSARNGGRWHSEDRKARDDAAKHASICGAVIKILEDELSRREGLRLQAERDRLARAAELQAAEAAKPAPAPKPLKRKSKSTFRPAQKRTEFRTSVGSFAELRGIIGQGVPDLKAA